METIIIEQPVIMCPLCLLVMLISEYDAHIKLHEHAEMLADIVALNRR